MRVAERRPFPASSAAENGSEIANRSSLKGERSVSVAERDQALFEGMYWSIPQASLEPCTRPTQHGLETS